MIEKNGKLSEKAILVGVAGPNFSRWQTREHLEELALLADTAGANVIETIVQERKKIDTTYYIGRGKVEELNEMVEDLAADMLIFDDDLTPAQAKNIGNVVKKKVIDRSGLILDIFARRAKTREARTQVELAQLHYLLPRLTRQWTHLSRQVGGIGTRGPGETQLEVDRRMIRKRISSLEKDLEKIERQRSLRRKHRDRVFKAALVGYTNVGKSTLLQAMTSANVLVEDRLFATLDATVRALEIAKHESILLIDTVGFIRKLPHHLVASFKSTLEEAREADLLLHVIDVTHPQFEEQIETVNEVLKDLDLTDRDQLYVFNKVDQLETPGMIATLKEKYNPSVFISARRGMFLEEFKAALVKFSRTHEQESSVVLHSSQGRLLAKVYAMETVLERRDIEDKIELRFRTSHEKTAQLQAMLSAETTLEKGQ